MKTFLRLCQRMREYHLNWDSDLWWTKKSKRSEFEYWFRDYSKYCYGMFKP